MAAALGWAIDGWQVVTALSGLFHHAEGPKISTNVRIGIGKTNSDVNMGGSVPHVALWDDNGHRIGQYKGDRNGHLDIGSETNFPIEHSQTEPSFTNAQATYLTLSMMEKDAICVSYISLTWPNGVNYMFFGDVGYQCGVDWYYSDLIVDAGGYQPRCIWLDKDKSNGLHFQGMGLHITDFFATSERAKEYQDIPDAMCKSTPRFQMYPNLLPDQWHSFYLPPLEYYDNHTDTDYNRVINAKGKKIGYQPPFEFKKRDLETSRSSSRSNSAPRSSKRNTNPQPSHLIVSEFDQQSAAELCGSEQSFGPDFVSVAEGIFCDMSAKEAWPLCDAAAAIVHGCFDLDTKQMVVSEGEGEGEGEGSSLSSPQRRDEHSGRIVPVKSYDSIAQWGPK